MTDVATKAIEAWIEDSARADEDRRRADDLQMRCVRAFAELRRTHPDLVEQVVAKHGLRFSWDYADYLLDQASDLPT